VLRSLPDSRDVLLDPRLANPDELLKVKPAVDAFEEAMVPILAEKDDVPVCTGAFYWVNRVNHHVENAKYSVRTAQNYYVTWDDFHWKYDLEKTVNRLEDLDSYLSMERYSLLYLDPIREVSARAHSNRYDSNYRAAFRHHPLLLMLTSCTLFVAAEDHPRDHPWRRRRAVPPCLGP
jgi:hypothetical protein